MFSRRLIIPPVEYLSEGNSVKGVALRRRWWTYNETMSRPRAQDNDSHFAYLLASRITIQFARKADAVTPPVWTGWEVRKNAGKLVRVMGICVCGGLVAVLLLGIGDKTARRLAANAICFCLCSTIEWRRGDKKDHHHQCADEQFRICTALSGTAIVCDG